MSSYVTYVLTISSIRHIFKSDIESICAEYGLKYYHAEDLYDWLIKETISDILGGHRHFVQNHQKHDVYFLVYQNKYTPMLKTYIQSQLTSLNINLNIQSQVCLALDCYPVYKLMVCGDTLFISKGITYA
jgi:hypothetical protein